MSDDEARRAAEAVDHRGPSGATNPSSALLGPADAVESSATTNAIGRALREPGTLQRVLCASLAWSVTVAPAAFSRAGGGFARAAAVASILAALFGPAIATQHRRIGRHVGISLFLLFSLGTWLLTPAAIDPTRLDSVRAAIGAIAWGVFAFSWGEPWTGLGAPVQRGDVDPFAAPLRARATLAPFAVPIAGIGVVTALAILIGVWQVHETSRALIAQAAAIGLSVALVSAGATVAVSRGKDRPKAERPVSSSVVRSLVLLGIVAIAGAVLLAIRP